MTTTNTNTHNFHKLFKQYQVNAKNHRAEFVKGLKEKQSIKDIKDLAFYRSLLTPKKWDKLTTVEEVKKALIEAYDKDQVKATQKTIDLLTAVSNAPDLKKVCLNIEWKNNRTWGANPTATADCYTSQNFEHYTSGSIGGCGYDKRSTAFAKAINQCLAFKKALFTLIESGKHKNYKKDGYKRDLYGFSERIGNGYGPYLSGGVGVECYPNIFDAMGYKFTTVANGKMFDAYLIELK